MLIVLESKIGLNLKSLRTLRTLLGLFKRNNNIPLRAEETSIFQFNLFVIISS